MDDGNQRCRTCAEVKPLSDFGVRSDTGRLKAQCKSCGTDYQRDYMRGWRADGPKGNPYDRPDGQRECRLCGEVKPLAEFYPRDSAGRLRRNECSDCHKALVNGRYDPERQRSYALQRLYGITVQEYDQMLQDQGGGCAICGALDAATTRHGTARLHIDHCHETNRVRGLLCSPCNLAIGHFKHDSELLKKAAEYLG